MISASLSTHSSHQRRKRSAVRRWPGQSRRLSATTRRARRPGEPSLVPPQGVGADTYIGPSLGTTCVAPVGRGDHTPPPGCSARWGRHRSAPIPVGSQTPPPPRVGADLCVRPPPLRVTRPRADTQAGPYGSHCNLHQTQNNGRGQSPAPTGTKGNEHPTPLRDLPGHPKPRLPQPKTPCMTAGTPPSSSVPRPNAKKHPRPSPNRGFQRGPQPPLVVSRGSRGENRAPTANQRSVCGGKRRSSGMSEPVPFWRRRGI